MIPEVAVPELAEDTAGYIVAIERHRYFQIISFGDEDRKRTAFYRANVIREETQQAAGTVDDFLRSLEMKACISPVGHKNLERSVQLINKTNQFNLTGRRYSTTETLNRVADPCCITWTVSLSDRFGDNGLISVLLGEIKDDKLHIDTWVMSCRVFKREVEKFLMNHLVALAQKRGIKSISGDYIPTAKNAVVRDLYPSLGFHKVSAADQGHVLWEIDITRELPPNEAFIEEIAAT